MSEPNQIELMSAEDFARLPVLMSRGELCALTGLSADTIDRLRARGLLPVCQPADGMRYRYHKRCVKVIEARLKSGDTGDKGSEEGQRR